MKNHMRFDVLTLFPQMFEAVLGDSIIGRARENNILEMNFIDIRDFSTNKHRKVDDYPYSGGGGMLMNAQPVYDAYMSVAEGLDYKPFTIYMSPQGKVFNQGIAIDLANYEHIVLLCGHYEGIDQRVIDEIVDMELSVGDFVMTGGEIPAMTVIDTVSRLVPEFWLLKLRMKMSRILTDFWSIRSIPVRQFGTKNLFPMYLFPVITRK